MRKEIIKTTGPVKKIMLITTIAILSIYCFSAAVLANNHEDRGYSGYAGTTGFATQTRDKTDASSAYIHHYGPDTVNVEVRSNGINYSANGSSYYVTAGQESYLPNYVYENGRRTCYLYLRSTIRKWITGVWSPDSI